MRKFLAFMVCVVLVATLAVVPVAAHRITLTAPMGTPTINGTFEPDVYGEFYYLAHVGGDTGEGADGRIALAWNDDYVFAFIEVNDTTPNHDNETNWQTDNVEFFFDWANNQGSDEFNDGGAFWQVRIHSAPGIHDFHVTGHANHQWDPYWLNESISYVIVPLSGDDLSNGYIIEAAFPRSRVDGDITFAEGMVIGFDVTIGDSHDGFERDSTAYFFDAEEHSLETNMWENPSAFKALLVLGGAPAAVEEEAAEDEAEEIEDAPVVEPITDTAAPQTADPIMLIALGTVISAAAGVVIAKKRK